MTMLAIPSDLKGVIDSHAHIDFPVYSDDRDDMLARMHAVGVSDVICIGTTLKHADSPRQMAEYADNIWFTVGVHPNHADEEDRYDDADAMRVLANHPRCVAIGEAGLDYFHKKADPLRQRRSFETQLEVASDLDLPIVIHSRNADDDMIGILDKTARDMPITGVMHCFSSGAELAEKALEIGFYISLSGILTFKTSDWLRDMVRHMPLDRLLVETDAPYLSPEPVRKIKRNEPAHVIHTLACLAELKGVGVQELADITAANTRRLFHRMELSA
ncbi:MAG: TatD family hydrolase [Candidatus Puniceispirillales bacterium]